MKRFCFFAVALIGLAACSKVTQVVDHDQAITFRALSYVNSTKADGQGDTQETNKHGHYNLNQDFGVFAYYNESAWANTSAQNATANVYMNNVQVAADGTPSAAYFWPKTSMLSFAAYAPYKPTAPGTFKKGSGFIFSDYVVPGTTDEDLMVVKEASIPTDMTAASSENETATHFQTGVPLLFNHLLTKLEFKFKEGAYPPTADVDATKSYIVIKEVRLQGMKNTDTYTNDSWTGEASGAASYDIKPALPTVAVKLPGADDTTQEVKVTPDPIAADRAFIVLPQALVAEAQQMYIRYNIIHYFNSNSVGEKMESNVTATIDLNGSVANNMFSENQHIIYTVIINPLGESTIKFDPAVVPWYDPTLGTLEVNN